VHADVLVSVVVNNYNYEAYLAEAIDSALGQTHPRVEVVVVDDGSSDGSRDVVASYGDRVIPQFKENGGQGSAINAGFAASSGEVVIFLDADDVLLPETASRVVAAFRDDPSLIKVHYRMQVVDATGAPTGELVPVAGVTMPVWGYGGDAVGLTVKFPRTPMLPTSAAAYRAEALRRILPMPAEGYRISADEYLNYLSPVLGPAASLEGAGVLYRAHGKNEYRSDSIVDLHRLREGLLRVARSYEEQRRLFENLYSHPLPQADLHNLEFVRDRLISLKLDPVLHPFEDRAPVLAIRGMVAAARHFARQRTKVLYALWFVLMLPSPRALAGPLAKLAHSHEQRRRLEKRLTALPRVLFGTIKKLGFRAGR